MDAFDLVSKERVDTLRPTCCSCRQSTVERLRRAKNEVWILGPQTPSGGRRATRVDVPAAWGVKALRVNAQELQVSTTVEENAAMRQLVAAGPHRLSKQ